MSNLYYTTSYGAGTVLVDGAVKELPEQLKTDYKNIFDIQVFGDVITRENIESPFFKCRNLLATMCLEYVSPDMDRNKIRSAHVAEAVTRVEDIISNRGKGIVVVNAFTYDKDSEELREVLKYLYEIVVAETKKTYNSSDDIIIYWDLNDTEFEFIRAQRDWGNQLVLLDPDMYIKITRK